MNLFVRIGAVVDGSLGRALNGLNNDLSRMDRTAQQLTARQSRLGSVMSQSLARPHADLGQMQQQYDRIGQAINRVTSAQNRLNQSIERGRQINELHSRAGANFVSSTAQLTGFAMPVGMAVKQAAQFQDQIIDIGITANLNSQQQASLGTVVRENAIRYNQTTNDVNEGLRVLVSNGIQDVKELQSFTPIISEFATSQRVGMQDSGNLLSTFSNQMGVKANEARSHLNMLAYAGKAGSFEIDSMAKWMPEFAQYYKGIDSRIATAEIGASFQVARMGAGSADEAANNFKNFQSKLFAGDTLRDFTKAGVDLKGNMQSMVANGFTPMQAMMSSIETYIGKKSPQAAKEFTNAMNIKDKTEREQALQRVQDQYKLGELFQDMQAMSFVKSYLNNKDKYNEIYQGTLKAGQGGQDIIGQDFKTRMNSPIEQFKKAKNNFADVGISIGKALLPAITQTMNALLPLMQAFGNWAKQNPQLVASIVKIVGGLLVAKVAFWGMSFAVLSVVKPIASAVTLFNRLRAGVAVLRGMAILGRFAPMAARFASGLRLIGTAFQALRIILMANPLGLAIGLLITAAVLIYRNWSPIKAFFIELWTGIKTTATNAMNAIKAVIANFHPIQYFTSAFAAVMGYLGGLPARFRTYGVNMIQGLIGGITAKFGELKAKMSEMANTVSSFFASKLGIRSPSRVFMGFGRNIAEGVAIGIGQQTPTAVKASDAMAKRLSQTEYSNKVLGRQSVTGGMGTGTIHFSPTIHVNGGGGDVSGQVQQGLQAGYREFLAMLERVERDRGRRAFA